MRSRLFTLKYSTNHRRKNSRFAVVVSKKVHKSAVGRNRIRRRVYEIIRYEAPHFSKVSDVAVIITNSEVLSIDHRELVDIIHQLFLQSGLLSEQ